ncbi:hypothetical protein [Paenibacillus sp. FSL R7-0179]|uniref:hypothetical protein n=1 Tax=Paenibacillus sp. FSL R7-0179 TaxID=2921672 RepID=UPI0030FC36D5
MEYITDIEVRWELGKEHGSEFFDNENLVISRAGHLWLKSNGTNESELLTQIREWHELDERQGRTMLYNFKTSEPTPINSFTKYKVDSINADSGAILLSEF